MAITKLLINIFKVLQKMEDNMDIILASKSPRRKELLSQIGIKYRCMPSDKEEVITKSSPYEVVQELSVQKAEDIEQKCEITEDTIIIGADTVVACDEKILGKPQNTENAFEMLRLISGRQHQVYTGVTVIFRSGRIRKEITFSEKTDVFVRNLSEEDIKAYTDTREPMDKAGAYGIQGMFAKHIDKINGDYNNVVGLPVARLFNEVRKNMGIDMVSGMRVPLAEVKAVIFDLDGTVLDTIESIGTTLNRVLEENSLKTHDMETYKKFVGDGQIELIKRALKASGDEKLNNFQKVVDRYIELFETGCTYNVKPYEGMTELLNSLKARNIKISIFSNKQHENVISIINEIFGQNYCDMVLGQRQDHDKKPCGRGIDIILNEIDIKPENCIYVGDTGTDMKTGKDYGLYTIGVTWGFRKVSELIAGKADGIVNKPMEIMDIIDKRWE